METRKSQSTISWF